MHDIETQLLAHRQGLLAFARRKVDDPALAEDVLQTSLLKALRAAPDLRDEEKLLPWFYQILNRSIAEHYRRRQVEDKYLQQYGQKQELVSEPEADNALCACFRVLMPMLRPEYAELLESLELADGNPTQVAERLGITPNNLKVRHHRARQALRQRLEESCRLCAMHGCLDCTCDTDPGMGSAVTPQ